MQTKISLEGEWKLQLDEGKQGLLALPFTDVITLPEQRPTHAKVRRTRMF